MNFYVIGIDDNNAPRFTEEVVAKIASGRVFSGGLRHYAIVKHALPANHLWIEIHSPMEAVFEQYKAHTDVIVFASGDPLFYGFVGTLKRRLPEAVIDVHPYFNSLQLLAHRMVMPYEDMRAVSLTGRPWHAFDQALIQGVEKIGLLTDHNKTPALIAARMLRYGYSNYEMTVGEMLGNHTEEQIRKLPLQTVVETEFSMPNCVMLQRTVARPHPFGIPEALFEPLDGRVNMITKLPIRLVTLSMLDLANRKRFWDVGFCTGSVSIEARLQFPHLHVTSFEIRPEGAALMEQNSRVMGAPGIDTVIGDFMQQDLTDRPDPDAVFIGGHGGNLADMVQRLTRKLAKGGVLVFNSVSPQSRDLFTAAVQRAGMILQEPTRLSVDNHNTIVILKAIQHD